MKKAKGSPNYRQRRDFKNFSKMWFFKKFEANTAYINKFKSHILYFKKIPDYIGRGSPVRQSCFSKLPHPKWELRWDQVYSGW